MQQIPETQGHKKLKQYFNDLLRNRHFMAKIKKLLRRPWNAEEARREKEVNEMVEKLSSAHMAYKDATTRYLKGRVKGEAELLEEIAEEYGIDADKIVYSSLIAKHENVPMSEQDFSWRYDMCQITDQGLEWLDASDRDYAPIEFNTMKRTEVIAYPIAIELHRFTTKRDILDFVEKRWDMIDAALSMYRGDKVVRLRNRKHKRAMADFIWENRKSDSDKMKELLNKKFPHNGLVYYEIQKIIYEERKRRSRKITVGQ